MTIWTVYLKGEPEFASDKRSEAESRYNFLTDAGYDDVDLRAAKEDGTPASEYAWRPIMKFIENPQLV